jgi:hypothetical protein
MNIIKEYNDVNYLINYIKEEDTITEPDDNFDKLIYNINKILSKPQPLIELIEFIEMNKEDVKQIARIIFVFLNNIDLMNEKSTKSKGLEILNGLIEIERDYNQIILNEYNYVYNKNIILLKTKTSSFIKKNIGGKCIN